jgi:hypothetical protein
MRAERERIDRRNHDVVFPVRDKHRLRDLLQISIGLASGLLPGSPSPRVALRPPLKCLECPYLLSVMQAVAQTGAQPIGSFPCHS